MERVIRGGFGLLLALTLTIWSVQGEQAPADDRPDFDVVPRNAARAILLHAATPECDTVRCCLSIEAGQPRARGDYEIVLSSNQYTDRTPTIVTEEGTPLAWIRSAFYGWQESVVCFSLKYSFGLDAATKPGSIQPTSYGNIAGCRSTPRGSGPITCFQSCSSIYRSSWSSSPSRVWRPFRQGRFSGSRPFVPRWLSSSSVSNTAGFSSVGEKRCCRRSGSTHCSGNWPSSTTGRSTTWTGIFRRTHPSRMVERHVG